MDVELVDEKIKFGQNNRNKNSKFEEIEINVSFISN